MGRALGVGGGLEDGLGMGLGVPLADVAVLLQGLGGGLDQGVELEDLG